MTETVAQMILEQLGGSKFSLMTGAKNFLGSANALSFSLPGGGGYCKDGINRVNIELTPADDYTVTFYRFRRGTELVVVSKHETVYCDQLKDVFETATGLYTTLGRRG